MKKEEKVILGKFGQVKVNGKEEVERIRKGNKNFSGQGGGEEGEGETRIRRRLSAN